jgi:hypothetical protein
LRSPRENVYYEKRGEPFKQTFNSYKKEDEAAKTTEE